MFARLEGDWSALARDWPPAASQNRLWELSTDRNADIPQHRVVILAAWMSNPTRKAKCHLQTQELVVAGRKDVKGKSGKQAEHSHAAWQDCSMLWPT